MTDLVLPGASSQVSVCALEETGLKYERRLVNLALGEQDQATYHQVNPIENVPALKPPPRLRKPGLTRDRSWTMLLTTSANYHAQ
jgi:glutathione S-transferase